MKFIHAADLHVDSPLRGLEAYEGAPVDRLRNATRESFENLITLAIDEHVDFAIIAGDLFDGKWPHMSTGIWTAGQFRRLNRENIPVYLLRGNHDAASQVRQSITWPQNVEEFSVSSPTTLIHEALGVALHGQGFPTRAIPEDLAAGYPDAKDGMFNIGVLHSSLTGDPQHDTYAPTTVETLVSRGYDYWALGHVHHRRTIREMPYIAFSGNTQGRHIHEQGPKGCLLVTVENGNVENVEFHATDTVRWHRVEIRLREDNGLDELYDAVRQQLRVARRQSDGRLAAVRVEICGACAAHGALVSKSGYEDAIGEIRNLANEFEDDVWVEKILLATSAPVEIEQLRQGNDLMGDLLRTTELLAGAGNEDELIELAGELDTLSEKASLELQQAGLDLNDPEQLRRWLRQAEGLLVSMISESEEA
jgi:DNA repair exonuclease SbcCD nuclease subunit